jgi:hypothetical protein
VKRWLAPSLLVLLGCAHLVWRAVPRLSDGSESSRHAHHAMHDESKIFDLVWEMVAKGDLNTRIHVYPGLYPYHVAAVRLAISEEPPGARTIEATRWLSLVTMLLALVASFVLFGLVAESPWAGALLAAFLGLHPEIAMWSSRVHPDAHLILFTHVSLALFALHVRTGKRALLWWTTVFAALSAGTKLVGCFVMPVLAGWLAYTHRSEPRRVAREVGLHALLFLGVLALTTPRLVTHTARTFLGFVHQQGENVAGGGALTDWAGAITGPNGLGWSGTLVALAGAAWVIRRRRLDAAAVLTIFAGFYLAFVLATVRLILPRYAFPTLWPALFVGLWWLVPHGMRDSVRLVRLAAVLLLYVGVDLPRQLEEHATYAAYYERSFTPDKAEMGRRIAALPGVHERPVVSSPYIYVPYGIEWRYLFDRNAFTERLAAGVSAVVLDPTLGGPDLEAQLAGAGFTKSATVGELVLYAPRPAD